MIDFTKKLAQGLLMDIIHLIRTRGFTVASIAREAGVSRPSVYALGDPDHKPTLETVVSVAKAIGVAPSVIRPELGTD